MKGRRTAWKSRSAESSPERSFLSSATAVQTASCREVLSPCPPMACRPCALSPTSTRLSCAHRVADHAPLQQVGRLRHGGLGDRVAVALVDVFGELKLLG